MPQDMNSQVAAYRGLVADVARQVERTRQGRQVSVEYDDLFQEGLIAVWQALERGICPSTAVVRRRMLDWIRLQRCQRGLSCRRRSTVETVSYETLLPIEDFRASDVNPSWPGEE